VFEIKTTERRQGYGLQAVLAVAERYDMPVTPVHIVGSAIGFWEAAGRHLALHGRRLTDEVRCSEMDREAAKWAHLRPFPKAQRDGKWSNVPPSEISFGTSWAPPPR
jgi:hypothetical protein